MSLTFGPDGPDYVFYHIPRTGGNFTRRVLGHLKYDGKPIFRQEHGHPHAYPLMHETNCFKHSFCVIREPLKWYESFYRFRLYKHYGIKKMEPGHPLDFYIWEKREGRVYDFDSFIQNMIKIYPYGYVTSMFCRVAPFCSAVLQQEHLNDHLTRFLETLGFTVQLHPKRTNTSPDKWPVGLTKDTLRRLLKAEKGYHELLKRVSIPNFYGG